MKLIQFYLYVLYVWPFIHYSKIINNSKTMFAYGNSAISIMTFYKDCMIGDGILVPMLYYQLLIQ